jgi:hypothetical protein
VASTGVDGLTTIVPISAISDWYDYSRMGGIRFNTNYPAGLSNSITRDQPASVLGVTPPTGDQSRNSVCAPTRDAMSAIDGDEDGDINQFWQDRNYNLRPQPRAAGHDGVLERRERRGRQLHAAVGHRHAGPGPHGRLHAGLRDEVSRRYDDRDLHGHRRQRQHVAAGVVQGDGAVSRRPPPAA